MNRLPRFLGNQYPRGGGGARMPAPAHYNPCYQHAGPNYMPPSRQSEIFYGAQQNQMYYGEQYEEGFEMEYDQYGNVAVQHQQHQQYHQQQEHQPALLPPQNRQYQQQQGHHQPALLPPPSQYNQQPSAPSVVYLRQAAPTPPQPQQIVVIQQEEEVPQQSVVHLPGNIIQQCVVQDYGSAQFPVSVTTQPGNQML